MASLGASADVGMGGGVAYWAHAGGFVFGAVLGYLLGLFDDADEDNPSYAAIKEGEDALSEPSADNNSAV